MSLANLIQFMLFPNNDLFFFLKILINLYSMKNLKKIGDRQQPYITPLPNCIQFVVVLYICIVAFCLI